MIRILCALSLWLLGTGLAFAHSASRSFSTWREDGRTIHMVYSIDQVQATLLIPLQSQKTALKTLLSGHLAARLQVSQNGETCAASLPETLPSASGSLQVQIDFTCKRPVKEDGWSLRDNAFFDLASTHIHIAQIENDPEAREFIFTSSHRLHVMRPEKKGGAIQETRNGFWANFTTYIRLGISHILQGFDHLTFVTALILLARNYKDVALLVTGFTLGHSITLSLATLGFIHPDSAAIEAMIGFSIAFVAMEILLLPESRDWHRATLAIAVLFLAIAGFSMFGQTALSCLVWAGLALFVFSYGKLVTSTQMALRASLALTSAFGLVHGAGFASVLGEVGLPGGQYLAALAGFNIGVEIGQLAVVAVWLIIFALARRFIGTMRTIHIRIAISAVIFALGIYWFTIRAFV